MLKLKKILSLLLVMTVTAGVAITGTIAYFTSEDSDVNEMTVGNVKITQNEQERVNHANVEEGLKDFTQNQSIVPAADVTGAKTPITVNGYHLNIRTGETYVDKIVSVTNNGLNDAYVRTIFAFPEAGEFDTTTDASEQWLHWNGVSNTDTDPNNGWIWGSDKTTEWPGNADGWDVLENVVINNKKYDIYVATNKNVLTPNASTSPSLMGFFLDTRVDYDGTNYIFTDKNGKEWNLGDISKLDILVLSQAVQTKGFEDAWTALDTAFGDVTAANVQSWFDNTNSKEGKEIKVNGTDKSAVMTAINEAEAGDTVVLTEDVTIAGYNADKKLVIDKAIVLDLNGKTITTESGWGGIDAKGGCSIKNGTINHVGNTAAIKAFQVKSIENVTINVTQTEGKTKGGIVVQEGSDKYVGSIKNVTITGATNGIETYRCGSRTNASVYAIGSMENVTIDATDTGLLLSAPVGTATNCAIEGDNIGINMYLYGPYSVSLDLVNSTVTGATGIYAHDEVGFTNPGSLTLTYDAATVIDGGITQEFEAEVKDRVAINL